MKLVKYLILLLILLLIGMGAFYGYGLLTGMYIPKTNTNGSPIPFVSQPPAPQQGVVTKFVDYTSSGVSVGTTVKIQGSFMSADPVKRQINGVSYSHVVGILQSDNSLAKIWLTSAEYSQIEQTLNAPKILQGTPVTFLLSQAAVKITSPFSQ